MWMLGAMSQEIQNDFLNELKGYIPELMELTSKLLASAGGKSELLELHRLVHTIRGASSLVKLNSLSRVASELEGLIEDVVEQRQTLGEEVFEAIQTALNYFNGYSVDDETQNHKETDEVTKIIACLTRLRSLKTEDLINNASTSNTNGEDCERLGLPAEDILSFDADLDSSPIKDSDAFEPFDETIDLFESDGISIEDDDLEDLYQDMPEDVDGTEKQPGKEDIVELPQEELLEGFYQEAEEHFQTLGEAMNALEMQIHDQTQLTPSYKELLRLIRRAVHTIKGAAAIIKLTDIADWGHAYEDLLDWLYEEAEQIDPEVIQILVESADMLERFVTTPDDINQDKCAELRSHFLRLIGSEKSPNKKVGEKSDPQPSEKDSSTSIYLFDSAEKVEQLKDNPLPNETEKKVIEDLSKTIGERKTLRVEVAKVEALVNLANELIIALSGFDENMTELSGVIDELERSRQRLKNAAHDLEVGYEVKAIQHLGSHMSKTSAAAIFEENSLGEFDDFDFLELDRYSEFNLLIRSLNETVVDVNTISTQLSDMHGGFGTYLNRLRILLSELQERIMRVRMTPMTLILNRLRRTVRETAGTLGKNVRLDVLGEEIELDKRIWEKLIDPIMHILRNAVDHGIESPARRESAGKPDLATIQLSAAYQGNQVVVRIADDGTGLDYNAIRQKAQTLQTNKPVEEMDESELANMIFLQSFSTRKDISDISGRGVGMDVVRETIESLKGTIQVDASEKGRGTTFMIRIPLTLAVMPALLFNFGGQRYATALYNIKEILRIHPRDVLEKDGKKIRIGKQMIPFYSLSKALFQIDSVTSATDENKRLLVLIVETGTWQGAIAIDQMYGQREIVIKDLGTHLKKVKGIIGATIMGDGKVVPIIDFEDLFTVNLEQTHSRTAVHTHHPSISKRSKVGQSILKIMVVDDSVSVRTVLTLLLRRQGWHVQSANDGVDAIEKLRDYRPDIILLDVEMPRMNGYEFMSTFRSQEDSTNIPVVMLTSRSAKKHRDKARSLGVNGYVVKPYEDEALLDLIRQLTMADGGKAC
jgi:chemosensory pili system protein ChpA (sensor histidine kinase/response regulator)